MDSRGMSRRTGRPAAMIWPRVEQAGIIVWAYAWIALVALFRMRVGLLCVVIILLPWLTHSSTPPVATPAHAAIRLPARLAMPKRPRDPLPIPARVPGYAAAQPVPPLAQAIQRAFHDFAEPYQTDAMLIVLLSQQFEIDASVPAALFLHEDGNINNLGLFPDHVNQLLYHTHNPGNIKCMYAPCWQGFQVYPTYRSGILDWFRLYDHYYWDLGIRDLGRFIATYCPPGVDGNGSPMLYENDVVDKAAAIRAGW